MPKLKRILYWSGPSLLCLLLYWNGLIAWFQMDDFAWLGLRMRVHDFSSFMTATLTPYAQGTIRPISERLFFMGLFSVFGMNALPFHMAVFATQTVNLLLLAIVSRRLTGSSLAGFAAPALWVVNANLHLPISWVSAYNQILCSTVLLLAFYLFLRFTETDSKKYYAGQWLVFLLGFGVLELVVVYPAIAALYALIRAPQYFKHTLPLFAASLLYTFLHRSVQSPMKPSVYTMHFDLSIITTVATYCYWALGPHGVNPAYYVIASAIAAALIAFVIVWSRKGDWLPLFFTGWYLITLAPYAPLRDHLSEYYLTVPVIGLAMLGGYALSFAVRVTGRIRTAAVVLVLAYAAPSAWTGYRWTQETARVSQRVQDFVERLAYAHKRNPDKTLLIAGMDSELFWAGFYDRPYRIFGLERVLLTEETEARIEPFPDRAISTYFLADSVALEGIRRGEVVVYETSESKLRNVTTFYGAVLGSKQERRPPRLVDAGAPMFGVHLREGWHPAEDGHRWMMKRASVEIGAPTAAGAVLKLSGYSPEARFKDGPVKLSVSVDGYPYPSNRVDGSSSQFAFTYQLQPGSEKKKALQVTIEVDKTMQMLPDTRRLGLVFGRFEVIDPVRD